MRFSHNAKRFLTACRAGATVDEMDRLLLEVRLDQQIERDARKIAKLAIQISRGTDPPSAAVHEVAALVERARYLLEMA